jgi:hypothetical protein
MPASASRLRLLGQNRWQHALGGDVSDPYHEPGQHSAYFYARFWQTCGGGGQSTTSALRFPPLPTNECGRGFAANPTFWAARLCRQEFRRVRVLAVSVQAAHNLRHRDIERVADT